MQVQLANDAEFSYRIERSARRRTVSIQIDAGEVVVRAPKTADALWINGWVQSKAAWIYPRLRRQQADLERYKINPASGQILLFGESFQIEHSLARRSPEELLDRQNRLVYLSGRESFADSNRLEQRLKRLLHQAAKPILEQRTLELAGATGLHPREVFVRSYKRKWGQCSSLRDVSLNWRILHLPVALQDYVIVHELCHLEQMNHSGAFWQLVERHCPAHKQLREQLKQYGACLAW